MAVQEAKVIRGNLIQKSEIAYSKAISEAVALRSSQSVALHREHMRLMQELEEQALREESKSCHDFLSTCQATLHHSLQPLPCLTGAITSVTSICSAHQGTLSGRAATHGHPSSSNAQMAPKIEKVASSTRATGEHVHRWDCPKGYAGRTI